MTHKKIPRLNHRGEERRSFIRDRVPFSLSLESEHPPSRPTNNNELLYEDGRGDDSDYYDARGPHNRRGLESFDDSRDTGGRKGGDEGDGEGTWLGAADAEREGEKKVDAARRRAVNLRLEGLAVLTRGESTGGSGSMSKRSPHQLFRQVINFVLPRVCVCVVLVLAGELTRVGSPTQGGTRFPSPPSGLCSLRCSCLRLTPLPFIALRIFFSARAVEREQSFHFARE